MTRSLAITEHQTRVLIRAAKKEGAGRIEVKIGSAVVVVFPEGKEADRQDVDLERIVEL